jgi:hypothetical protein
VSRSAAAAPYDETASGTAVSLVPKPRKTNARSLFVRFPSRIWRGSPQEAHRNQKNLYGYAQGPDADRRRNLLVGFALTLTAPRMSHLVTRALGSRGPQRGHVNRPEVRRA